MSNLVNLKCIWVDQTKKDGSTFKKAITRVSIKGETKWVNIYFGDMVNDKPFREKNVILTCPANKVTAPTSFEPFTYKGKKCYQQVRIDEVVSFKAYTGSAPAPETNQAMFEIDNEEANLEPLPFE